MAPGPRALLIALAIGALPTAVACSSSPPGSDLLGPTAPESAADDDGATPSTAPVVAIEDPPFPADNPPSAVKTELGRLLFWDPILSGERDVACATCHQPALGYADGKAVSTGTGGEQTTRSAMPLLDVAWNGRTAAAPRPDPTTAPMFWDNRARSLESQAAGPITAEGEMRGGSFTAAAIFPELVRRLAAIPAYVAKFETAFGSAAIDERAIARALAAFERSLVTVSSYDRFLAGDTGALTARQKRGLATFRSSGCDRCHAGPMFSDYQLHRLTRGGDAVRTPSLRNITRTAPYMHDGRASDLAAVFDVYRRADRNADPQLRRLQVPNGTGRDDIAALFEALSDGELDRTVPAAVPSGLAVGGDRSEGVASISQRSPSR